MNLHPRRLMPRLTRRVETRRACVLTGARQTGKTTLVRELLTAGHTGEYSYYSLDDPEERLRLSTDPVRAFEKQSGIVVLDEVQKLPMVLDAVKILADRNRGPKFILLGSSQILLLKQVRETLAGRTAVLDLWPLSVSERTTESSTAAVLLDEIWARGEAALESMQTPLPADVWRRLRSASEEAVEWGGFPGMLALEDSTDRREWFRDYRRTFLERDLADLGQVSDLDHFARSQAWLASRTGEMLNLSALARDLGVAVNTAKRWVRYLELSYQVVLIPPMLSRMDAKVAKTPKLLWTDVGVARSLSQRHGSADGALFETHIGSELIKWLSFRDDSPELEHFRVHSGLEVDFVLRGGSNLVAIECKSASRAHEADGRRIRAFLDKLPGGTRRALGLVVYRGREVGPLAEGVWAVPDALLLGARDS